MLAEASAKSLAKAKNSSIANSQKVEKISEKCNKMDPKYVGSPAKPTN
jgi:hypothetical protein